MDTSTYEYVTDVAVSGKYAFVGTNRRIHVVDVGAPTHPTLRSIFNDALEYGVLHADWLRIVGDRLYVREYPHGADSKTYILDISNPDQLKILGTIVADNDRQILPLEVIGDTMYATSTTYNPATPRFFEIWDVSDPANPQRRGQIPLPVGISPDSDAVVSDGRMYIAASLDNNVPVYIMDVSDTRNPRFLTSYTPRERPVGIDVKNHLLYIHTAKNRSFVGTPRSTVEIVDLHDPRNPILLARYTTPEPEIVFSQRHIMSRGGYIYVVEGDGGMEVLWYGPRTTANLPTTGGTLSSDVDSTRYEVAAGTFANTVKLTHTPKSSLDAPDTAPFLDAQHIFEVSTVDATSNTPAQLSKPLAVTISYEDLMFTEEIEAKLRLYWWDGTSWIEEPSSVADPRSNIVSADLPDTGTWALLAEPMTKTYAPLIFK